MNNNEKNEMKLKGKTVVHLVADEFEDIELLYPLIRLSEEGAENIVVPIRGGLHTRPYFEGKPVTGRFGTPLPIPVMQPGRLYRMMELEDISVDEMDCLHFCGGYSPDYIRIHQPSLELTRIGSYPSVAECSAKVQYCNDDGLSQRQKCGSYQP